MWRVSGRKKEGAEVKYSNKEITRRHLLSRDLSFGLEGKAFDSGLNEWMDGGRVPLFES